MSRIGTKPVKLPAGVKAVLDGRSLKVAGPKGELSYEVPDCIKCDISDGVITFARSSDERNVRALHGTARAITANNVTGVSEGFVKNLELHGQGYKAALKGKSVELFVGLSHPVYIPFDDRVKVEVKQVSNKLATISVSGIDKLWVGHFADQIRRIKPPEHYRAKGGQDENKGIRYKGEKVRTKAGKSGA
ncbi:MAG: 50S ribosomal protein L6 [bacterium]|jgi:large subunit ribosomal protein L6